MTTTRTIALWTTALIVGSLAFANSMPTSASPPTRFDVCPAILSQRICDLLRMPDGDSARDGAGGSSPSKHR